ncbi:MAG: ABC transporter permease [Chloroflexota bacterium]|nr:ABC transporter permease [Chloroflexota bacterium]
MLIHARRNMLLVSGLAVIMAVVLVGYVGSAVINQDDARVGAFDPGLRPSAGHLLGTDRQARDVLAVLILSIPNTVKVGLLAGAVGLGIGIVLGLAAGYFGGLVDLVIRTIADVVFTIPGIAIMIIVATNIRTMSVEMMALIVASLSWMYPTRAIRAQTLSLRERLYVEVARLNGESGMELVVKQMLPNLLPYIAAGFVASVSGAILATIGLEALGLGPQGEFTLGMMIYWARFYGAILRGMWWWWSPPIAVIVVIFIGLLLASAGLDRIANPRLQRSK